MSAVGSADIHITVLLLHTIHSDIVTQRHIKCVQNIRVIRSACSLSVPVTMRAAGLAQPISGVPRNFVQGGSTNSVEDRTERTGIRER